MSTSSNMVLIETKTVGVGGSANIEFTGIPQTGYTDLKLVASLRMNGSSSPHAMLSFNNSNTSSFSLKNLVRYSTGSTIGQSESAAAMRGLYATLSGDAANTFGNGSIYITNYAGSTNKSLTIESVQEDNTSNMDMAFTAGLWPYTNAITSLKLTADASQSFVEGSTVSLYGIKSASKVLTPKATGGIISTSGDYVIHTFTASGTFTPTANLTNVEYLVIAGGGGGGSNAGAGGGAGGYRSSVTGESSGGGASAESKLSLTSGTGYTVTIGAGGSGGYGGGGSTSLGSSGLSSTFGSITSTGGGYGGCGGYANPSFHTGASGGSGGGGSSYGDGGYNGYSGGSGTSGQGYRGGNTTANGGAFAVGGGGGAGGIGQDMSGSGAGVGGAGLASSITGTSITRASGGSGWTTSRPATGGGGGNGAAGTPNTGGGGGEATNGGSGIVIVRYVA